MQQILQISNKKNLPAWAGFHGPAIVYVNQNTEGLKATPVENDVISVVPKTSIKYTFVSIKNN